jgi:hypothetical protein
MMSAASASRQPPGLATRFQPGCRPGPGRPRKLPGNDNGETLRLAVAGLLDAVAASRHAASDARRLARMLRSPPGDHAA